MFARFYENPAMTLQDIKETKRYRWTHGLALARTDNVKTVYPPQTEFAGGININKTGIFAIQFYFLHFYNVNDDHSAFFNSRIRFLL